MSELCAIFMSIMNCIRNELDIYRVIVELRGANANAKHSASSQGYLSQSKIVLPGSDSTVMKYLHYRNGAYRSILSFVSTNEQPVMAVQVLNCY